MVLLVGSIGGLSTPYNMKHNGRGYGDDARLDLMFAFFFSYYATLGLCSLRKDQMIAGRQSVSK